MNDRWSPVFPTAKDDDDDDVAWALSTAQVQWKRGSQADAVVWLRRAADSAVSVGATWRAAELTRQTDELEASLARAPVRSFPPPPPPPPTPLPSPFDDFDGTDPVDSGPRLDPLARPQRLPYEDEVDDVATEQQLEAATEIEPDSIDDDEIDEDEIAEDEIDEDEIAEDEIDEVEFVDEEITEEALDDGLTPEASVAGLGRDSFPESEAPTASFSPESAPRTVPEPSPEPDEEPDTETELNPQLPDEDPAPTPMRLAVASTVESEPAPALELTSTSDVELASEPQAEVALPSTPELPMEPEPPFEPEPEPEPEAQAETEREPEPEGSAEPLVGDVLLSEVRGFEDFPPETQLSLAKRALVERLGPDEEVSGFGLALVLRGKVNVMPAIADAACGQAGALELIYGKGTLADGVALRLVAMEPGTEVAVWDLGAIEPPLAECPWVLEELQAVADRYQALAGVAMGPMGDRLDDALRSMVMDRCKLIRLLPGELLVEKGKPAGGLFIVGAGRLELGDEPGASQGELGPGDFLFATQVLSAGAAPTNARAGAQGTLVMAADRHTAHELMLSVPPLLELLAG